MTTNFNCLYSPVNFYTINTFKGYTFSGLIKISTKYHSLCYKITLFKYFDDSSLSPIYSCMIGCWPLLYTIEAGEEEKKEKLTFNWEHRKPFSPSCGTIKAMFLKKKFVKEPTIWPPLNELLLPCYLCHFSYKHTKVKG